MLKSLELQYDHPTKTLRRNIWQRKTNRYVRRMALQTLSLRQWTLKSRDKSAEFDDGSLIFISLGVSVLAERNVTAAM